MSHYPDLSAYDYLPETVPDGVTARNVGWLSGWRRHPRGQTPEGFPAALAGLCRDEPRARTRGRHTCRLCHRLGGANAPAPTVGSGDDQRALGTAEVRVITPEGEWLNAPDLIHHYVTVHHYLPPAEFVEAVIAGRVAPEG